MGDIKHRLTIACASKKTNLRKLAKKWNCTATHIDRVARDGKNSARIRKNIVEFIQIAEKELVEEILIKPLS